MQHIIDLAKKNSRDYEKFILEAVQEKIRLGTRRSFPDDFCLTTEMQDWFKEQSFEFDIIEATDDWTYSMTNNRKKYRYSDWTRAWQNGMKKFNTWSKQNGRKRSNQTAYEEFKNKPRRHIEEAKRLRQIRASSNDPRTCGGVNRPNMGQNDSHIRPIMDNSMGRY